MIRSRPSAAWPRTFQNAASAPASRTSPGRWSSAARRLRVLGVEPGEPERLVAALAQLAVGVLGQRAVVVGVAVADRVVEALRRELADRREHREALVLVADQAVGGERGEVVRGRVRDRARPPRRPSRRRTTASAWKRSRRRCVEQVDAPGDRARERPLAGGQVARRRAGGDQLERERQPVERLADRGDLVGRLDPRAGGARAGDEQRHGLVPQRERLDRVDVLAVEAQRAPARDQAAQAGRAAQQLGDERRGVVDVLEVVEQQQRRARRRRSAASIWPRRAPGRAAARGRRTPRAGRLRAACSAIRVLPTPPGPTSVTSRASRSSARDLLDLAAAADQRRHRRGQPRAASASGRGAGSRARARAAPRSARGRARRARVRAVW